MIKGLVSIIMSSYNSSSFLDDSIMSVINQSYVDWELLITDDCSQDYSVELIQKYTEIDHRIKLFSLNRNVGAAAARNNSLEKASGKYIAFLDSDDIWLNNKLECQLAFMKLNDYAFTFSAYDKISEFGEKLSKIIYVPRSVTYNQLLRNTIIGCLTVIIDKEKTGDFRMPIIKSAHDTGLWLSILKRGFIAYGLNEVLATYRVVSNSNTANKWKAANNVWKLYRDIEKLSILQTLFCFCYYSFNSTKKRI